MASKWGKSTSQNSKSTGIWLVDHRQVRALVLVSHLEDLFGGKKPNKNWRILLLDDYY